MKLKKGFVIKEVAGQCVAVSVDAEIELKGVIALNSTAKALWLALENGVEDIDELALALTSKFEVDEETAKDAAEKFVAQLGDLNFLE